VRHRVKPWARRLLPLLDAPTRHASRYFLAPSHDGTTDELLTPQLLLENLPRMTRSLRVAPDYDEPMLEWLFAELHHNRTWGTPQRRLVRDGYRVRIYIPYGRDWFPYFMRRLAERPANLGFLVRNFFR